MNRGSSGREHQRLRVHWMQGRCTRDVPFDLGDGRITQSLELGAHGAGDVRGEQHVGQRVQRVTWWEWLGFGHVQVGRQATRDQLATKRIVVHEQASGAGVGTGQQHEPQLYGTGDQARSDHGKRSPPRDPTTRQGSTGRPSRPEVRKRRARTTTAREPTATTLRRRCGLHPTVRPRPGPLRRWPVAHAGSVPAAAVSPHRAIRPGGSAASRRVRRTLRTAPLWLRRARR